MRSGLRLQRPSAAGRGGRKKLQHCGVKCEHGPQNLAAFRNAAITLLRSTGLPDIARNLRRFAHQPRQLLRFLGILKQ